MSETKKLVKPEGNRFSYADPDMKPLTGGTQKPVNDITDSSKKEDGTRSLGPRAGTPTHIDTARAELDKARKNLAKSELGRNYAAYQDAKDAAYNLRHKKVEAEGDGASYDFVGDEGIKEVNGRYEVGPTLKKMIRKYAKGDTDNMPDEFIDYLDEITSGGQVSARDQAALNLFNAEKVDTRRKSLKGNADAYKKEADRFNRRSERIEREAIGRNSRILPFKQYKGGEFVEVPDTYFVSVDTNSDKGPRGLHYIVRKEMSPAGVPIMVMYTAANGNGTYKATEAAMKSVDGLDNKRMVRNNQIGKKVNSFSVEDWENNARAYAEGTLKSADDQKEIRLGRAGDAISVKDRQAYDEIFRAFKRNPTIGEVQEKFPQKWANRDDLIGLISKMNGGISKVDERLYPSKTLMDSLGIEGMDLGGVIKPMPVNPHNTRVSDDDVHVFNTDFAGKNIADVIQRPDGTRWDIQEAADFIKKMAGHTGYGIDSEGNIKEGIGYQYETPGEKKRRLFTRSLDEEETGVEKLDDGRLMKRLGSNVPVPLDKMGYAARTEKLKRIADRTDKVREKKKKDFKDALALEYALITGEKPSSDQMANLIRNSGESGQRIKALSDPVTEYFKIEKANDKSVRQIGDIFQGFMQKWGTDEQATLDRILRKDPEGKTAFVKRLWQITDDLRDRYNMSMSDINEVDVIKGILAAKGSEEGMTSLGDIVSIIRRDSDNAW